MLRAHLHRIVLVSNAELANLLLDGNRNIAHPLPDPDLTLRLQDPKVVRVFTGR